MKALQLALICCFFNFFLTSCGWLNNSSSENSFSVQLADSNLSEEETDQEINAESLLKNWRKTFNFWQNTVEDIEYQLQQAQQLTNKELTHTKSRLQYTLSSSNSVRTVLQKDRAKISDLLDTISETDEDTDNFTSELLSVKKNYENQLSVIDSRLKLIELIQKQVRQLFTKITDNQQVNLLNQLSDRTLPELNLSSGLEQVTDSAESIWGFFSEISHWLKEQVSNASKNLLFYLVILALIIPAAFIINRIMSERLGFRSKVENPTFTRKLIANLVENLMDILLPALLIWSSFMVIANELFAVDTISPSDSAPAAFLIGILAFAFIMFVPTYFIKNLLVTDDPKWRIDQFHFNNVPSILRQVFYISLVFGLHVFYSICQQNLQLPNSVHYFISLAFVCLEGILFLSLISSKRWQRQNLDNQNFDNRISQWARKLTWVIIPIAILATFLGYLNFGTYLVRNIIFSLAVIILFMGVIRQLSIDSIGYFIRQPFLRESLNLRIITLQRIKAIANLLVNPLLFLLAVYSLLRIWGVENQEINAVTSNALSDLEIGNVIISPSNILLGIFTFFIIVYFVKQSRSYIAESIMPDSGLNVGSQYAISSVISYVGYALAILIAIVVAGVDLGNVALIASALSIGIGFGLQEVVSNFVSGIILILERPIKVGDWVKIDTQEGIVRKINFRSTEIETFAKSNIIIPNSTVLSSSLVNMTHNDEYGRIELNIGISYEADVEDFKAIALAVLKDHPNTLEHPEPKVFFIEHADSSLNFKLMCFTSDIIKHRLEVASTLRTELHHRLKAANIEIPFPQRVLHVAEQASKIL